MLFRCYLKERSSDTVYQLELFDYKPDLLKLHDLDCPKSLLDGKKFAFIQGTPKMLGPQHAFKQYGESGTYVSDILPHFSSIVDEVTLIKSMHTDQFNYAPAQLLVHTGDYVLNLRRNASG